MSFLSWNESFSVNHIGMDEQHAKIFKQISLLWDASFAERKSEAKEMVIQGLIQSIQKHFRDEEQLLEIFHYRDLHSHRSLHNGLNRQLIEFDNKLNKLNYRNTPVMMEFLLSKVVMEHIMEIDHQYIPLFMRR